MNEYSSFSHSNDQYWHGIEQLTDKELLHKVLLSYFPDFDHSPQKYIIDIDHTYPKYILENKDRLSAYIYNGVY